jgi:3(or 17)beta-hydroxysteroid dehydrogenase
MSELEGRIAVVTGAASGIGRASAELLARAGAHVVFADIEPITPVAGEYIRLDVTSEPGWEALFDHLRGRIDILVNNAGIAIGRPVTDMTAEEWHRVLAVNLDGVFFGTKHAVRAMRRAKKGGVIINISSAAGLVGTAGASAYSASKGAVRLFTKAVALECAPDDIRVSSIHPGAVRTPIWEKGEQWNAFVATAGGADAAFAQIAKATPLGRLADPSEIAEAVLYLASDRARFVTGSELVIDGGYTAG